MFMKTKKRIEKLEHDNKILRHELMLRGIDIQRLEKENKHLKHVIEDFRSFADLSLMYSDD